MTALKQPIKKILLCTLQFFTRRKGISVRINDFILRMPAMFFNYYSKNYETGNFEFLKKHLSAGHTFIDVGAHAGVYSLYAARYLQATAYAFEPSPATKEILDKNVQLNDAGNSVFTFPFAVAAKNEPLPFYLNEQANEAVVRTAEANALFTRPVRNVRTTSITVNCICLDEFVKERNINVGFLKIDAEGAELEVLRGARCILEKDRPAGIAGIHTFFYEDVRSTLQEIWSFMHQLNYHILYHNRILLAEDLIDLTNDELFDIHFIPAESFGNS